MTRNADNTKVNPNISDEHQPCSLHANEQTFLINL